MIAILIIVLVLFKKDKKEKQQENSNINLIDDSSFDNNTDVLVEETTQKIMTI